MALKAALSTLAEEIMSGLLALIDRNCPLSSLSMTKTLSYKNGHSG